MLESLLSWSAQSKLALLEFEDDAMLYCIIKACLHTRSDAVQLDRKLLTVSERTDVLRRAPAQRVGKLVGVPDFRCPDAGR